MNEGEESGRFTIKDRRGGWWRNEINLGNIIQLIILLFTLFFAWAQLDKQQELLRTRFDIYIAQNEKEKSLKESLDTLRRQVEDQNAKLEDIKRLCR